MMEQKLKWCPKCMTIVPANRKMSPMALIGALVILGNVIDIPILLAFVPRTPMNMGVMGFVALTNVIIGVFFIRKGGIYRCSVCNTPTPSDRPPAAATNFGPQA